MKIIDLHCDVLEKLTRFENVNFRDDKRLHANLERLKKGQIKVQIFAIFIHPRIPQSLKFHEVLRQIKAFQEKVLKEPEMIHITDWKQVEQLKDGQIGAVLSLEGCDAIGNDIEKLKYILNAGVKLVGLTWNYENGVAYGASEDPEKGLKPFGHQVIELLNEHNVIIDVAHLNEKGFYEVLPLAKKVIASHCNSRALCDHARNLTDHQVRALIQHGGRIHIVFYPPFIEKGKNNTSIIKLMEHIQHLSKIIGVNHIGFGSDFDGIDPYFVTHLSNASEFPNLITAMQKDFSPESLEKILWSGFLEFVRDL